jgi:ABC-type glycerol-3-phosphate transport system substrate-binding protein
VYTSYARDPALALDFMEHMLGEATMRTFWDQGLLVTYRFADTPAPTTRLQGDAYAAMQRTGPGYYMGVNCAEVNRGIWDALQAMIADNISPADTMANVQAIYAADCPKYRTGD